MEGDRLTLIKLGGHPSYPPLVDITLNALVGEIACQVCHLQC
jgi:hypothetical protein